MRRSLGSFVVALALLACSGDADDEPAHVVQPASDPAAAEKAVETPAESPPEADDEVPEGLAPPAGPGGAVPEAPAPATPVPRLPPQTKSQGGTTTPKARTPKTEQPPKAESPQAESSEQPPKAEPPKAEPPKTAQRTTVPRTKNVRVEYGGGMQALLDADPRMQPWINAVIRVAQSCYEKELARNAKAAGVIRVRVTMHDTARPTPDIESIPTQLGGLVACATPDLMRRKMPLFTGPEGQKHTLKIHFSP